MRKKYVSFAVGWSATLSLAILLLAATALAHDSTEIVLHNFGAGSDGVNPDSSLIFDTAGNLYGTTYGGGTGSCGGGCGTVFELTPNGGGFTESVIYNFQGATNNDGAYPLGALTADAAGNFYGVTYAGGHHDCGTVFELTPGSGGGWTESVLYSFCANGSEFDGSGPTGKLVFDASGNLYGVTQSGGHGGGGVVFQLMFSSGTWTEKVIKGFPRIGHLGGNQPVGIIFDSAGNLYGVTTFGGTRGYNGAGIVFELVQSQGQWTGKVIHRFGIRGNNLQTPTGGLIFDAAGNLYMTMARGGLGGAGVFEISPRAGGGFKGHALCSFPGGQILQPYEGLVFDSAGSLYSASGAEGGGNCSRDCGFVYKLSRGAHRWKTKRLAIVHGRDGINPVGGVILDSKGNLYGATFGGGANKTGGGVVFEVTP